MAGKHEHTDTDPETSAGTLTEPGLRHPRDFLLADERAADYELNLTALAADLQPRGRLEERQVELIAIADWEGMRHRRLTAALLDPAQAHLQPAETPSARTARQHVEALASMNGKERRPKKNFLPEPSPGDRATTADILRAQRNNMPAIEFHQRQAAAAERTRRQGVELLLRLQDRRRQAAREDAVEDAVVVEAGSRSSGGPSGGSSSGEPSP